MNYINRKIKIADRDEAVRKGFDVQTKQARDLLAKARTQGKIIPDNCEVFFSDTCFRKYRCNQCFFTSICNYHLIAVSEFDFSTGLYGGKKRVGIFCKECAGKLGLVAISKPNADVVIRRHIKGTKVKV